MSGDRASANERFKARYRPLLLACIGRSVILHVLVLAAVPGIWIRTTRPMPGVGTQTEFGCGIPLHPPVVWYSSPDAALAKESAAAGPVHDSPVASSYSMLPMSDQQPGGAP